MTVYDSSAALAKKLIAKYGRSLILRPANGGTFDPTTFTFSGSSADDVPCRGVVSDYKTNEIDGTDILRTDQKILLSADVTPNHNDKIIDGATIYTIVNISPLQPGDTT